MKHKEGMPEKGEMKSMSKQAKMPMITDMDKEMGNMPGMCKTVASKS